MKNTSRKYKSGNKFAKQKGGGWRDMLGMTPESDDTTQNNTESIGDKITSATNSALNQGRSLVGQPQKGESDISHLNRENAKLMQSMLDIDNKLKENMQKLMADNKSKTDEELKKMNEDVEKEKAEILEKKSKLEEEIKKVVSDAQKNISDAQKAPSSAPPSAPPSAPGSAVGSAVGGGRRRRSGARRSGARRSGARNGRSKSKSKGKKRITRKKGRNNKKRTRRYKKH